MKNNPQKVIGTGIEKPVSIPQDNIQHVFPKVKEIFKNPHHNSKKLNKHFEKEN